MRFSNTVVGLAAVSATGAYAQQGKTIKVTVGADKKLMYSPNDITAEVGTTIEFDFFPANHTVTQSSFADPCHPLNGGFFSGFVPTKESPSGTTFTITVKDKKPIWFYCSQGKHCQTGMVGAINAPKEGNTLEKFTELAKKASGSTAPPTGPVDGELHQGGQASSSPNQTGGAPQTSQAQTYTSTWTSAGTAHTTTVTVVAPPPQTTSWAYTTKPYTSTWTKDGQTFTSTATTTLFSVVTETPTGGSGGDGGAATTTSSKAGASGLGVPAKAAAVGAGAFAFAAAAMF